MLTRRRLVAALLGALTALGTFAARSTPPAGALSTPIPGLTACAQQSLICGSGGQVLADDVATATSLGLPYLLTSLAPATSVLFLSGDSASTQTIVQGCAYKISQNSGYPVWNTVAGHAYPDALAGYQTSTDCAAWHLLAYGVYSSSTIANSMPWQRSFCRAIYSTGVAFGGTTGATGTAWSKYGTSGGFPSGLQTEVNMACPVAWRSFFLGGAAPSANPTYPAITNYYSNSMCNAGITPASGAAPSGSYGTWALPVNVSLTFVLRCYFPSGTFATVNDAPTAVWYRPTCPGALPTGDSVCPQIALGAHPGGTGPEEVDVAPGSTFSAVQVSPTSWQFTATVPSLWAQPDHAGLGNSTAPVTIQLDNSQGGNWEEVGTEDWRTYPHTHFAWAWAYPPVGTDAGIWPGTPPWPVQAVGASDQPVPNCTLQGVTGVTQSFWCISQAMIDEWNTDAAIPNEQWVTLCHGSLTNGSYIKTFGLRLYMDDGDAASKGATYVSADHNACHDAAFDSYARGAHLPQSNQVVDQWIVGSLVPVDIYNKYFQPYTRAYQGWNPYTLQSTEILLGVSNMDPNNFTYSGILGNTQIGFFNLGIYNWGYTL